MRAGAASSDADATRRAAPLTGRACVRTIAASGVTVDVGERYFETVHRRVTLLDTPGHRDFIPHMITGAARADAAVLVVDAQPGELEAVYGPEQPTPEHVVLVRALGVSQLIVALNKMDLVDWSRSAYEAACAKVGAHLRKAGFREHHVCYVAISGFLGENLVDRTIEQRTQWYTGATLAEAIDRLEPPPRSLEQPLRMCVANVFTAANVGGLVVCGRIIAGTVQRDERVCVLPSRAAATVKSLEVQEAPAPWAVAGDAVTLTLSGLELSQVRCVPTRCRGRRTR